MGGYKWHTVLLLAALVVLHPFTTGWFTIAGVKPDVTLSFFLFTAFGKKGWAPLVAGFATGLAYDFLYSRWIGMNLVIYLLAALLCVLLSKRIYRENLPGIALFAFITVYLLKIIYLVLSQGKLFFANLLFFQREVFQIALYAGILCGFLSGGYLLLTAWKDGNARVRGRR
ncbi:MAG: rod shape-determining protein MreD [Clostridia bacterium]